MEETRSILAVELSPASLKLVEYLPSENRVLAVAVELLEPARWGNDFYLEERLKAVVARYRRMESSDLVTSVPGLHAIVRIVEIPADEENILDAIQWDMEQYLARTLDQYVMDYRLLPSGNGSTYLVAAYRRSEVARIQNLMESTGIRLAALNVDVLSIQETFSPALKSALAIPLNPLNAFKNVHVNANIDMLDASAQCATTLTLALQYTQSTGINLLSPPPVHVPKREPLEYLKEPEKFSEWVEESPKRNRTWVFVLSALVLALGLFFAVRHHGRTPDKMDLLVGPQPASTPSIPAPAATPESTSVAATTPAPTVVPAAPDSTVAKSASAPSKDTVEDVAFQQFAGAQWLHDLLAAASEEVGFSRVSFTAPDGFQVHGVATTEADMQHFQNSLNTLPGLEYQENKIQSLGTSGAQREFTFSGRVHYSKPSQTGEDTSRNRAVAANALNPSLQRFLKTAKSLGIHLDSLQLKDSSSIGGFKRLCYHTEARCDYVKLQILLEKLHKIRSNVGVQKLALEARGEESMIASLDLAFYTK